MFDGVGLLACRAPDVVCAPASRAELDEARRAYEAKELTPMAFVETLEELEGRGAFPSDWLYSSGVDDLAFADNVVET